MTDLRPKLFNSTIETGVRSVLLLNAAFPNTYDVTAITWFDHLIVHTGDIGGPTSLHPDVPQRSGELLVRRRLVEEGLSMMRRLHLVDFVPNGSAGLLYRASEEAGGIVELLSTPYAIALKERASWMANHVLTRTRDDVEKLVASRVGRWNIEFRSNGSNNMESGND
ncbi:ABC-three component system middle component 2 [Luteibacter sp.]|uniref:ABC-three component system middle component 2 n=1 Tax=Luteibacter sp. TaxID=1886636 RepID=UPI003F81C14F